MRFRRTFIVALALGILGAALADEAQQPTKVPRIGVLWPTSDHPYLQAFRQGLRDLGYVEGQTIVIEYRYARGKDDRLPDLAAELVRLQVGAILTWGTPATQAAKQATRAIPIVMGTIADPVTAGLVASLARPGGNVTGLTSISRELAGKRLELTMEVIPGLSRVAVLSNPANPGAVLNLRETEAAARSRGMRLQVLQVRGPNDFESAFEAAAKERAGALVVLPDPLFSQHAKRLVDLAAKHRLPAMYYTKEFVDAGGLMSYAPSYPDMFRRAASYVDKILKGAKPGDLPVEQPTRFELVINLKTAKALGLTIPQSVLIRADQVIQ